ncbi:MAG: hypothetical protein HFJ45_06150 [Clostridia bacterium]|nr:hypothetical protein [Clostridia bacterium]
MEEKEKNNKSKKRQIDSKKIVTSIIAGILCILMLLSVCGTLLAYIFAK